MSKPSLAIYLPDLSGGGAERLHLNLVPQFLALGYAVTFLVNRATGPLLAQLPTGCQLDILPARRQLTSLPSLVRYIKAHQPDLLVTNMEHMSVLAVLARRLARSKTRVVVIQHITLARPDARSWGYAILPWLYRLALPHADAIVAVSHGVVGELQTLLGPRPPITVIPNGIGLPAPQSGQSQHPWLAQPTPLVLAIGRLVPQKDFPTLIRALAQLPEPIRLIILGDGPLRASLADVASKLGIDHLIDLPGFVPDPTPYLQRANVLALSSVAEGFGNVIVEALACGTPVVATDCPHGPAEILDGGRYGRLVPMRDPTALATAIAQTLKHRPDPQHLKTRAADFTIERCAGAYHRLFTHLLSTAQ